MIGPIYLPGAQVACTPYRHGMRVSGSVGFHHSDDMTVPAQIGAMIDLARPFLDGVRWAELTDVWAGMAPATSDGRPLIGEL